MISEWLTSTTSEPVNGLSVVAAYGLRGAEKVCVEDQVAAQLVGLGRDAQRSVLGRVQQRIAVPRVELPQHVRDASVSDQSAMVSASGASWAHLPVVCPCSHTSRAMLVSDQSVNGHESGIGRSIVRVATGADSR